MNPREIRTLKNKLKKLTRKMKADGVLLNKEAMQIIVNKLRPEERHWGAILLLSIVAHARSSRPQKKKKRHSLTESFIKGGAYDSFATKHFSYPKDGKIKAKEGIKKMKVTPVVNPMKGKILKPDGSVYKKDN